MYSGREIKSEIKQFNLDAYFNHVKLNDFKPSPLALEDLSTIIKFHLNKFIYQNNDLYNAGNCPISERSVSTLDIDQLFGTMIALNGGYCFQHLELLYSVLKKVGFNVERHLGKIILQSRTHWDPKTHVDAKTHELLITHIKNKSYIVDVGMANMSLRAPLELKEGENTIEDDHYRLIKTDNLWTLDTKTSGKDWFCLYQFFNLPVSYTDVCNAHKNIVFTDQFIPIRDEIFLVGITNENKRKQVIFTKSNNQGFFKSISSHGKKEPKSIEFQSVNEAKEFAIKKFGMM